MKTDVDRAGWTLKELAQDHDLVGDAPAPLFAWSLLRLEEQYLDALGREALVDLQAARVAFSQALLAQLEQDRESLEQLVPGEERLSRTDAGMIAWRKFAGGNARTPDAGRAAKLRAAGDD